MYNSFNKEDFINAFKENDLNVYVTCKSLKISRGSFYNHFEKDNNFRVEITKLRENVKVKEEVRAYKKFNEIKFVEAFKKNLSIVKTCKDLKILPDTYYAHVKNNAYFKDVIENEKFKIKEDILSDIIIEIRERLEKDNLGCDEQVKYMNYLLKVTNEYTSNKKEPSNQEVLEEVILRGADEIKIESMLEKSTKEGTFDRKFFNNIIKEILNLGIKEKKIDKSIHMTIEELKKDREVYDRLLNQALENESKVTEEIEMMSEVLEENEEQIELILKKVEDLIKPYLNKKNIDDEINDFWDRVYEVQY